MPKSKTKVKPPAPDQLWKSIIEDLWESFLWFFFPKYAPLVDFKRQPEFLDKELANLAPPGRSRGRVADKLIKLWLQDGMEAWILVHVEVQGKQQTDFARRMAQMGYRIFDRHGVRPAALAVLTDDTPDFQPRFFETAIWGQVLRYEFATYKVSENLPENYPDPANPFALVMESVYFSLRKHKLDDPGRLEIKERLLQKLYAAGYTKKTIFHLLSFIRYIPRFEKTDFTPIFDAKIDQINQIQPIMTTHELHLAYVHALAVERGEEIQLEKVVLMLTLKGFTVAQIKELLEIPRKKIESILQKQRDAEASSTN